MPEAPEVQTVLSTLEDQIKDLRIEEVQIRYEKLIENESVSSFIEKISNQHFRQFHRYGKYLIFALDDYDWIVHLRMEGKFYLLTDLPKDKHIHAGFLLSDGRWLCYHDTRKFGRMKLYLKQRRFSISSLFSKTGAGCLRSFFEGGLSVPGFSSFKQEFKSMFAGSKSGCRHREYLCR